MILPKKFERSSFREEGLIDFPRTIHHSTSAVSEGSSLLPIKSDNDRHFCAELVDAWENPSSVVTLSPHLLGSPF